MNGGATKYLFKVKNKDAKTIPMVVFLALFCLLSPIFFLTHRIILDFEVTASLKTLSDFSLYLGLYSLAFGSSSL